MDLKIPWKFDFENLPHPNRGLKCADKKRKTFHHQAGLVLMKNSLFQFHAQLLTGPKKFQFQGNAHW